MSEGPTIAILGAGKMGEALISGLLRAGRAPTGIVAVARRPQRAAELHERAHHLCFIASSVNFPVRCEPSEAGSAEL